jgi:hypothetical protein
LKHVVRCARTALVSVLASALLIAGAEAQVITQSYVGGGYSDGWTATIGLNFLKDISAVEDDPVVDEGGMVLTGYAGGGVRTNPGDLTAQFGLGLLLPTDGEPAYWGPVALVSVNPWGGGGGVRIAGGFGAGMAWLTLGVMKLNERSGISPVVNVDLTTAFICDVTPIC